jgi:hypothetical protein
MSFRTKLSGEHLDKRPEVTEAFTKHDEELHSLRTSRSIIRIRWAGFVARMGN